MPTYTKAYASELRTLQRGLTALAFLNECGAMDISTLARKLEIPRANTYRILHTLISQGYCVRIPNSRLYMVLPAVGRLSKGAGDGEILTAVSIPVIEKLGVDVEWPIALSTPSGSQMLVRLATDRKTSLALARPFPGYKVAMPLTATGILYLALERPEIADPLLTDFRKAGVLAGFGLSTSEFLQLLDFARSQHYLIMESVFPEGSIGVPIIHTGRPIAGLVMRYIKSALPRETVTQTFLPKLRVAAAEILRLYVLSKSLE